MKVSKTLQKYVEINLFFNLPDHVRIHRAVAAAVVAVVIHRIVHVAGEVENHVAVAVVDLAIQDILDPVQEMHDIVVDRQRKETKICVSHHSYLYPPLTLPNKRNTLNYYIFIISV